MSQHYSARDLLRMPREERNRILAAAAEGAADEYGANPELTAFEAFGDDDLFDEYPEDDCANVAALPEVE